MLRNASGEARDAVHRLATTLELEHNVDLSTKIVDRERFERLRRTSLPFWRNYARDERVLWPPTSSQNAGHHGGRSSSGVNRTPAETSMASKEQIPVRSDESRDEALRRIRERWKDLPETTADEIDRWRKEGRTGQKVVTFDGGMLLKFPEWTISVSDFIASSRDTL